jgi:hypothetical protein
VIKNAWDELDQNPDVLLFGSHPTGFDLFTLHPDQVQIFQLWQVYIENVNPLLRVIHVPSMQGRIIDAATNVTNISPTLTALMFGIYSVSILSLSEEETLAKLGTPKERLMAKYNIGCQRALSDCGFLRSDDRDCLTALYLYLVSEPIF